MRPLLLLCPALLSACGDSSFSKVNTAPSTSILNPLDGSAFEGGALVEMAGLVGDGESAPSELVVTWSSSLDGELGAATADASGNVSLATASLTEGTHAITLMAVDPEGKSGSSAISIQVGATEVEDTSPPEPTSDPPEADLDGPVPGSIFTLGEAVTFVGSATDPDQAPDTLSASLVSNHDGVIWSGAPDASGFIDVTVEGLRAGDHTVTLEVVDAEGNVDTDDISFTILEDGRPEVSILTPEDGSSHWTTEEVIFTGLVSDDLTEAGDLQVTWSTDLAGVIYAGAPAATGETGAHAALTEGVHLVTLAVVDTDGNESTAQSLINVVDPNNSDDDGDGVTENEGDCDDANSLISPLESEICDDLDNNCDGQINEDWADTYEANDSLGDAHDLGEVDSSVLWAGESITISGLSLHEEGDADYFTWQADDEWYDNVSISVRARNFPSGGSFTLDLYMRVGSTWDLKDSSTGSGALTVGYEGDIFDTSEDDFVVVVYASSWPAGYCSSTYMIEISS
jgi:hypothetical protein